MKHFILAALFLLPLSSYAINHSSTIPYPFYVEDTSSENQMMPLHKGEESFQLRLEMIKRAQSAIEVEYYIYAMDLAGKIFTRELVKAADRGVKVRILVDKLITGLNPFLGHELAKHGIEVKYYNTNVLFKLGIINYRNHRKLLVVDGQEAITGGRNLGDDYFNIDHRYNFDDRDVYVKGPIVKAMRESFDAFYNHKISHTVRRSSRPVIRHDGRGTDGAAQQRSWDKKVKAALDFLAETDEEINMRSQFERIGGEQLEQNNLYTCPTATFVSDTPGTKSRKSRGEYEDTYRNVRKTFLDKILPIDKALTISSPYFIPNGRKEFIFENLLKRGVEVTLYSNSLRSTDAIIMSTALYLHLSQYLKQGMKVFFHDGRWAQNDEETALSSAKGKGWGTHSKTHVYETSEYSEVMIGTYNIDNRSDYYNTELAVYCKGNDDFSKNVKGDIMALASKGIKVEGLRDAVDRDGRKINITGASPGRELKMKLFTLPTWLLEHLL